MDAQDGVRREGKFNFERKGGSGVGRSGEEDAEDGILRGLVVGEGRSPVVDAGKPGAVFELEEEEGARAKDVAGEEVTRGAVGIATEVKATRKGVAEVVRKHQRSSGRRPV
jgi:hypothetical protein